jgi:PncC family amidohydrolase
MDEELLALANKVGDRLRERGETIAIAESSSGGLVAAALLAVPGASSYFRGGAVVYTGDAKSLLLDLSRDAVTQPRAATREHALVLARGIKARLNATWGIGETGAAGPTGNRYGDPAGHSCVGVAGPSERVDVVATGSSDRAANMVAFAVAALRTLEAVLA